MSSQSSVPQSQRDVSPQLDAAAQLDLSQQMLVRIHRGGGIPYFFTTDGDQYVDKDGKLQRAKAADWGRPGRQHKPRPEWLAAKAVFFGVNTVAAIPTTNAAGESRKPHQVRARNSIVDVVNCFFAEFDGKDDVTPEEWEPHYQLPDLTGLSPARQRGALQTAQTEAIDRAYKVDPDGYKRRAWDRLLAAPLRASYVWDSGGGFQAIWLLDETVTITDDNRAAMTHTLKGWVHLLGGDPAATDLARVLRLPGSRNWKAKYGPGGLPVKFTDYNPDLAYPLSRFVELVPAEAPHAERKHTYVPPGVAVDLGDLGDVPFLPVRPAISRYNTTTPIRDVLLDCGYTDAAGDKRMNRQGGDTAGVLLHDDNSSFHFSSNDPLYSEHRIKPAHALCVYQFGGNVDALLDHLTDGFWTQRYTIVAEIKNAVHAMDLSEGIKHRDAAGRYMTRETDLAVIDALLDHYLDRGELRGPIPLRKLQRMVGVGNHGTIGHAVTRLLGWMLQPTDAEREYKVMPDFIADMRRRSSTLQQESYLVDDLRRTIYSRDRAHDAFTSGSTPLTAEAIENRHNAALACEREADALQVQIAALRQAVDTGKAELTFDEAAGVASAAAALTAKEAELAALPFIHSYALTRQIRRRFLATLPGAGRVALVIVATLEAAGGKLSLSDLARLGGRKPSTIRRAVARMEQVGIVTLATIRRGVSLASTTCVVRLVPTWKDVLTQNTPRMPAAGKADRLEINAAQAAIKQCDFLATETDADLVRINKRRKKAMQAAEAAQERLDLMALPETTPAQERWLRAHTVRPERKPQERNRGMRTPNRDLAADLLAMARTRSGAAPATDDTQYVWSPGEYSRTRAGASAQWPDFGAWLAVNYGPEIIGMTEAAMVEQYRVYQAVCDYTPTVHFDGGAS